MKLVLSERKNSFNVESDDALVRLRRVSCVVEWRDGEGVRHVFDSPESVGSCTSSDNGGWVIRYEQGKCPTVEWTVTQEDGAYVFSVEVVNSGAHPIRLLSIAPFVVDCANGGGIELCGSVAQAYVLSQHKMCADARPLHIWAELYHQDRFFAQGLMCVHKRDPFRGMTCGFISTARQFGYVDFEFDAYFARPRIFSCHCDMEGVELASGKAISSEKLWVACDGSPANGLDRFASRMSDEMRVPEIRSAPTGWSTWDFYFGNISEEHILENVDFLARHRDDIPVEYIQIDAGYTDQMYEWRKWTSLFPHGPKWLVAQIKKRGFKAGLWLVPFWGHKDGELARAHPEWFVKNEEGVAGPVAGDLLALDGSHPEVEEWLADLARTITAEWGFEYIKIDGASHIGTARGTHHDPNACSCEAYRKGIEAFRRGMTPGTLFMGGVFGPSVGVVDAMRIGNDVGARWDWSRTNVHLGERDQYHGSGNVKRAIMSTLNSQYLHERLWINDGDYLVVRDDRSELVVEEARTWATVLGLHGGSLILSDRMATLSDEKLAIIAKVLPLPDAEAVVVDFLKRDIPELLRMDLTRGGRTWTNAAVFNFSDSPAAKTVDFSDLGLDEGAEYHVNAFWRKKYLGRFQHRAVVELEPHACEVLSICRSLGVPQVVGTDIHVTQGGVELERVVWDDSGRMDISLEAAGHKEGGVRIWVPEAWELDSVEPECASHEWSADDRIADVRVEYEKRMDICVRMRQA